MDPHYGYSNASIKRHNEDLIIFTKEPTLFVEIPAMLGINRARNCRPASHIADASRGCYGFSQWPSKEKRNLRAIELFNVQWSAIASHSEPKNTQ